MKNEGASVPVETLVDEIKIIYKSDNVRAEKLIETYLEQRLKGNSMNERLEVLDKVSETFRPYVPVERKNGIDFEQKELQGLVYLLLGKDFSLEGIPPEELLEKLSNSLNTVFDKLNHIVRVINSTLLGESIELETIRHIIGSDLEKKESSDSLQSYLEKIQDAFLMAHRAFQLSAGKKIEQILNELNPENISSMTKTGLKFGPLAKAKDFDIYKEKFKACKDWFESGRMNEELLREFESTCQKLYKKKN